MSDYRVLLDRTAETLSRRGQGFRNLVIVVVVIGFCALFGVLGFLSLRPLSIGLLAVPAYALFLWRDNRMLGDWRRGLAVAWQGRRIDFSAVRQALGARQSLPQATVQSMLATLPVVGDLAAERGLSAGTRAAIALAMEVRDECHAESLACCAAGLTCVTLAAVFAMLLRTWMPFLGCAVLPVLVIVCAWSRCRRFAHARSGIRGLLPLDDRDIDQYREALAALDWTACAERDKVKLRDIRP